MPGGSKKGGGLTTKKSTFYKMKGFGGFGNSPMKHSGSKLHNAKYSEGHEDYEHQKPITAKSFKKDITRTLRNIKRKIKHGKQDIKDIKKTGKLKVGATESKWAHEEFKKI